MLTASEERALRQVCTTQWIDDVPSAFEDIPREAAKLSVHGRGMYTDQYSYTKSRENAGGSENHFQGCARLPGGPFLAMSGGDWGSKKREASSHLFVAKLGSRGRRKKWGSNVGKKGPPSSDRIVKRLDLHGQLWHAGGIDLCGHVLAVPVECGGGKLTKIRGVKAPKCDPARSRILFLDMEEPERPRLLAKSINRGTRKATAVALIHVPGAWYVAAVLSTEKGSDAHRDKRIDFYRTAGNQISRGFPHRALYRVPKQLKWDDYQTINFAYESSGKLFLFGMTGRSADLFEVTLPWSRSKADLGSRSKADLQFYSRREFKLDRSYGKFRAGVGVYMAGGVLSLYAVPMWRRRDGRLRLSEWAP